MIVSIMIEVEIDMSNMKLITDKGVRGLFGGFEAKL